MMERLTQDGVDYCLSCGAESCAARGGNIDFRCPDYNRFERLRAYERTGLEPEEIEELLHDSTGPLHKKLGKWIKAEAEGRLVGWIPVTERLPPEDEEINEQARWSEKVIFWHMGCGPRIGWYSRAFNVWSVSGNIMTIRADFVTHWMPLPEPPEAEAALREESVV